MKSRLSWAAEIVLLCASTAYASRNIIGQASIIDGDTIEIRAERPGIFLRWMIALGRKLRALGVVCLTFISRYIFLDKRNVIFLGKAPRELAKRTTCLCFRID